MNFYNGPFFEPSPAVAAYMATAARNSNYVAFRALETHPEFYRVDAPPHVWQRPEACVIVAWDAANRRLAPIHQGELPAPLPGNEGLLAFACDAAKHLPADVAQDLVLATANRLKRWPAPDDMTESQRSLWARAKRIVED